MTQELPTQQDSISKTVTCCRICGKKELKTYLDLGELPLANNLFNTAEEAINGKRYPLKVQLCDNCGLSQLSEVIDPRVLFSKYAYRSSMSQTYVKHCRRMAKDMAAFHNGYAGAGRNFIIDIAGNDGALLKQFKEEMPHLRVLNIDPAANLTEISRANGIPAHTEFFGINSVMALIKDYGHAQTIIATNVFAHVDNIRNFLLDAKYALHFNGTIVLEFPYLIPYIEGLEYGTTYHEHLSYIAIAPLKRLCDETGLKIIDVSSQNIHCGTVRVIITHATLELRQGSNYEINPSVNEFTDNELRRGYDKFEKYNYWAAAVNNSVQNITEKIHQLRAQGKTIAAFGASAKGNTLLNLCNFTENEIAYIVDDTPEKQGKFSPGTGIAIVDIEHLKANQPDYILILAWNFTSEIKKRLHFIYTGKLIIPIPSFEIQ